MHCGCFVYLFSFESVYVRSSFFSLSFLLNIFLTTEIQRNNIVLCAMLDIKLMEGLTGLDWYDFSCHTWDRLVRSVVHLKFRMFSDFILPNQEFLPIAY